VDERGKMKRLKFTGAVVALVFVLAAVADAAEVIDLPGFLSAKEETPVKKPESGQQVAVFQVQLESDGQKVQGRVLSQKVISSFAPKSVARSAGEWEVRIKGQKDLVYQIPNPLTDIEVERPDDEKQPFEAVKTDSYDWTLIVPLYHDGEPLGARTIEVVDLSTQTTVLSAEVPERDEKSGEEE
jgi:hypothetical protein